MLKLRGAELALTNHHNAQLCGLVHSGQQEEQLPRAIFTRHVILLSQQLRSSRHAKALQSAPRITEGQIS